ncbi:hypothetical protein GRF29_164g1474577 [Pseudopithomyces chartarum]|uniref:alpha-galactosidase n=1 Tax=Pseudopithomyces chartarum TaxID=1892770 RepID=A0AAN6LP95_9PLEO|nr:hypothetical protein GRF29_164g1474577 [Pseudopithomyces chartarum]
MRTCICSSAPPRLPAKPPSALAQYETQTAAPTRNGHPPKNRPTPPRRRKLLILSTIALTVLALALGLGLGLGLTLGRDSDDDNDDDNNNAGTGNNDGSTNTTLPPTPRPTLWRPSVNSTWQIVLQSEILLSGSPPSITPNVDIYDVDLFETPKSTITTLHSLGKKVICYFSAGSYEKGRPDAGGYEESDLGDVMEGWPDERWVRLGSESVRRVVKGRVELAAGKGCDAVDGDNVDGFQNKNGLSLTASDSISFMSFLSNITAPLNLSLGLKNAGDIIPSVLPLVHFSVNEQCVDESECETFAPFIEDGKPVFHIEYPDGAGAKGGLKEEAWSSSAEIVELRHFASLNALSSGKCGSWITAVGVGLSGEDIVDAIARNGCLVYSGRDESRQYKWAITWL